MRAYEIALRSPGSLPRSLYETLFSFMVRDVEILNDDMKLRSLASPAPNARAFPPTRRIYVPS